MQKGISNQVMIGKKKREARALKCDPEKVDGLKWQVYLQQINQYQEEKKNKKLCNQTRKFIETPYIWVWRKRPVF